MAELLGVRSTLASDFSVPMFWTKEAFCAVLGAAALVAAARLARPGSRLGWVRVGLAGPLLAMWLLAAVALGASPLMAQKIETKSGAEISAIQKGHALAVFPKINARRLCASVMTRVNPASHNAPIHR